MIQIGLKLFSINQQYVPEAVRLVEGGVCQYIELYSYPDSYEESVGYWKGVSAPFIIHAPHYKEGLNFALKEKKESNFKLAHEAFRFADSLKADKVIFHPGVNGETEETARQMKEIFDGRMLIENKPQFGNGENLFCNGHTPEEIKMIMDYTGASFCFDFGHGICSANSKGVKPLNYVGRFLELKPALYHLTDGDFKSELDRHDHYGKGSFPLKDLIRLLPDNCRVTNEAVKDDPSTLRDVEEDILYFRNMELNVRQ